MIVTDWMIHKGTEDHAGEIAALVNRAYSGDGGGWTNEKEMVEGPRTSTEGVLEMMGRGTFLLARESHETSIRASVFLERRESGSCYVGMLSVDPVMQDRGLGKTMMRECEWFAKTHGISRLSLTVLEGRDTLQAWYRRHGFEPTGEKISMAHLKDLRLLVFEKAIEVE